MKSDEVGQLLAIAATYQANLRPTNAQEMATMAKAWYMALDTRMTLNEATVLLASLASETKRIHPGTLNDAYLETIRPPHQQGLGRPHLPFPPKAVPRKAPQAIGAPQPVAPKDVPEYAAVRAKAIAENEHRLAILRAPCEYCGAGPGKRCVNGNGEPLLRWAHPSREEASKRVVAA